MITKKDNEPCTCGHIRFMHCENKDECYSTGCPCKKFESALKLCEKCEEKREEKFFESPTDDICIYCKEEMGVLNGEILTEKSLGKVIQSQLNQFQKKEEEVER